MMRNNVARLSALLIVCGALALWVGAAVAQNAAEPKMVVPDWKVPMYDVVSIKPNNTGSRHMSVSMDEGNFDAVNVSLKLLLLNAYGLKDAQLINLPKWDESARFDVKAKLLEPDKKLLDALSESQLRSMERPILTERFQLKFHREKKVLPVYELVVAKDGPKFKEAPAADMTSDKGVNGVKAGNMRINDQNFTATAVPLSSIADTLSSKVQRVVLDKTGLTGKYNLQLSWSNDDAGPPAADTTAPPDIFTALQEQLGLKLQASKAEIETFVIDQVVLPDVD